MNKLLIMCLSLFAIVFSSGASHAGLSLDRCSPFFAVSYHGNIDTNFNETHHSVKCDWDENKTISVIRKSHNEPALIFTYQKDTHGKWGIWPVLPLDTVIVFLVPDQSLSRNRHSELRTN